MSLRPGFRQPQKKLIIRIIENKSFEGIYMLKSYTKKIERQSWTMANIRCINLRVSWIHQLSYER
jgi:hypothetical protein